ncbi:MAG TPA: hypothetical protein VEL11_01560 [Candidatus Bathyarchaeia archaeon]|nr:hypothetical protein [Candidatus Bathyarchaeia archaeon]
MGLAKMPIRNTPHSFAKCSYVYPYGTNSYKQRQRLVNLGDDFKNFWIILNRSLISKRIPEGSCGISDTTSPGINDIGFGNCTKNVRLPCSNLSPHTSG